VKTSPPTPPHEDQFTEASDKPGSAATEEANSMAQSLYTLIAQQPFFKGLNAHQLQLLTESAMEMQFEPGQSIFQEGSPANRFYLILEGKVVLESELAERGMIPIQTLGRGDDLGWSWLFPPYYLHSSARALEPTRTIFFYGTRLREQCEQDHDLGYQLMQRVAEVMIQRLRAMQQRLMECTDTRKLSHG
jgi:CRP/FNR family transcriptional regulator, cyclic AMP receptor protein